MRYKRHTNNDARNQIKAGGPLQKVKEIARRAHLRADSRLPESRPLPPPPIAKRRGIVTRLKEGENCAPVGWQFAPKKAPAKFFAMVERGQRKQRKREKYQRQYARRAIPPVGKSGRMGPG